MVTDTITYEPEIAIEQRFGVTPSGGKNAASWQGTAEVVPVGGCRTRRENLTQHCNLLVSIENLAQNVGAGPLRSDNDEKTVGSAL
jgi:hypothetical protein